MNKDDFEEAFRKHYTPLVSYVRTITPDEEDCHDIVSRAFEEVWKKLDGIDQTTVRSYLYRSVNNMAINQLRKQRMHRRYVEFYKVTNSEATTSETAGSYEERINIANKVVDSLGEPTRTILIRCYIEGKMYREVAQEFGVSTSAIKKHMIKALRLLGEFRKKMLNG